MAKRMLIDATHPEETRVVVLNGNRLEEFDFETSTKKQVKGNIYLAKVTRVEPSLQAAFIEYGGNRHGFLAFSEIHPDYYRIPVADRRANGFDAETGSLSPETTDAADESGVPLEEALPEPIAFIETERAFDDGGEPETASEYPIEQEGAQSPSQQVLGGADSSELEHISGDPNFGESPAQAVERTQEEPGAEHAAKVDSALTSNAAEPPARTVRSLAFGRDAVITSREGVVEPRSVSSTDDVATARDSGNEEVSAPPDDRRAEAAREPEDNKAEEGKTPWSEATETPAGAFRENHASDIVADNSPQAGARIAVAAGPEDVQEPLAAVQAKSATQTISERPAPLGLEASAIEIIETTAPVEITEVSNDGSERPGAVGAESEAPDPRESALAAADVERASDLREFDAIANGREEVPILEADSPERAVNGDDSAVGTDPLGDAEDGEREVVETLGGDEFEEVETQRLRLHRHYKIQEVIKRRQIMLVQVTKEERGNKGAALTTYLSLAGRYCVLMPNTGRGGGVSRKITNIVDRRRLKEILEELDIPEGMGVIVRTAGAERSKAEIKRDYEYLLRLWNEIRELTLRSTAPALIYEEGDLIKRSIRDLYTRDIDEVLVEGEEGYRTAKAFMKMLMPSHAKRVQPYRDPQIGLLHRFQVESQIDAIHSPLVQLRSGGYVVIDQTEALVAIDVNSGRATRERNIEETALRTNLEAAEEIARQLRLRDLAGLIVIDFIDMEEHRNQAAVERRLKEALKSDRARIQVGRISPFGLLEMSRQRLRSSLTEASTQPCPHCGGTGFIRSTESTALYVLRSIEEEGMRRRTAEICVYVPTTVALYILNHKRDSLAQLESRYGIHVLIARDDSLIPPAFRMERLRAIEPGESAAIVSSPLTQTPEIDDDEVEEDFEEASEAEDVEPAAQDGDDEPLRARRRRRRRRRHEEERNRVPAAAAEEDIAEASATPLVASPEDDSDQETEENGESDRLRRRRGRRGGRRRGRREENLGTVVAIEQAAADSIEIVPVESEAAPLFDQDGAEPPLAGDLWAPPADPEPVATDIETASLPAFAGEPAAIHAEPTNFQSEFSDLPAGESSEPPPYRPSSSEEESRGNGLAPPPDSPAVSASGDVSQPVQLDEPEDVSEPLQLDEPERAQPASVAAPPTSEIVDETELRDDIRPPSAEEPALLVQQVIKKPENPRRGWWQRLIQS